MKTKAEQKLEEYLTGETPDQAPAPTPDQAPAPTPDQVVDKAAKQSSDQAEPTLKKAAAAGNETAKKVTGKSKEEKEEEKRRQAEEEEEQQRIEEEQQRQRDILSNSLDAPAVITRRGAAWLSSAPTPGGVGMLLLALIMFLWIIVPVNAAGDTRAKLLFYTLTGRTKFNQQYEAAEAAASATGGGTDFGDSSSSSSSGTGNGTISIQPGTAIILSPFEV
jgi:cation transport ATPase